MIMIKNRVITRMGKKCIDFKKDNDKKWNDYKNDDNTK